MLPSLNLKRLTAAFASGAALLFCAAVLLCSEGSGRETLPFKASQTQDSGAYLPLQSSLFCLYESNGGAQAGGTIQAPRQQSGCARLRRIALKFNHVFMRGGELVLSVSGSFLNPAWSISQHGFVSDVPADMVVSLRKLRL